VLRIKGWLGSPTIFVQLHLATSVPENCDDTAGMPFKNVITWGGAETAVGLLRSIDCVTGTIKLNGLNVAGSCNG
jgi:hypothetical protein